MKRHDIHLNPKNPAPHLSRTNADFNEGHFKNMCLSFFSQHVNTYKLLNYRSSCSALYTTEMLPQRERDVSLCHLKTRWSFFHKDEALQDPCFINWGYYFLERPQSENRWSLCAVCIFAHVLLVRVWVRLSGSIQQSKRHIKIY